MGPKLDKNKRLAQAILMQMVQRQYLTKLLGSLKPHSYGLTFSLLVAVVLGVLQAMYGYLTVPHEYGHVWAAELVGHKVKILQIDFFDQTKGLQDFFGSIKSDTSGFVSGASPPPPAPLVSTDSSPDMPSGVGQKVQDYSQDGKLGFVLYEPSMVLVNFTVLQNLSDYNSFAEATQLPSGERLPVFTTISEALQVAGPNATASSDQPWIQINVTHHLEVQVTPWESLPDSTSTADFAVSEWLDKSNSFGLSLGPEGVTVFRALGGPAMDMLIICCLLVTAAVLVGMGFSSAGALFFLLGFLAIALQADYPFLCAFAGMSGDYRKAAEALSSITAWHSGTLMKFWALAWLTVPLIVFTVVFWFARAVRVRRLRRAHITRMLCNLNWVVSCTRFKGGSQGDGTSGANDVALLGKGFSRESVAWTLGAATSNQLSDKKPEHIIKATLKMARRRSAMSVPPALLKVFEDIVANHVAKYGETTSDSCTSNGSGGTFSVNKMLLQNPAAAGEVGKALGERARIMARLSLQFHRSLSRALADTTTKSVQRMHRHARRVVVAEVRSPPPLWLEQMANHCDTVSRFPSAKETHQDPNAWVTCDASWSALSRGTSRTFRSLHHILVAAGPHHYRRAAAAWAVRRWLLIAAERGRLLTGPRPHWWPLLHLLAVFVALCSGLCDLSDSRRQCMAATTSVVAVISVLNIVPMVIALRWGLQPRAHASSTQPGTEHSAVTASDEAPVKGETVPLNPHDVRTRVMSASHAWLHPVRKFLKIPHRSGEYTVSQGTHLFQGRDLPVLVQLRRDGSPDLPPLKIPEDIQGDVRAEKASRKSMRMSMAARKSTAVTSVLVGAEQGANTSSAFSRPSQVGGPARSYTITVAPSNDPFRDQQQKPHRSKKSQSRSKKAHRKHANRQHEAGHHSDAHPNGSDAEADKNDVIDSKSKKRGGTRSHSHSPSRGGTSKRSHSRDLHVRSNHAAGTSSSPSRSPDRSRWRLSGISTRFQTAFSRGVSVNLEIDPRQLEGRNQSGDASHPGLVKSKSGHRRSGCEDTSLHSNSDMAGNIDRSTFAEDSSPDRKGIVRKKIKDAGWDQPTRHKLQGEPVYEGLECGARMHVQNTLVSTEDYVTGTTLDWEHSEGAQLCPEVLDFSSEDDCDHAGYSAASAVSEGVNAYGGTDNQQPGSQPRSQDVAYGYGSIDRQPSSQRNMPGSRGVMWPHLVPSSTNNSQPLASAATLPNTDNPTYPTNAPESTPVPGSHNPYTVYNTAFTAGSMVSENSFPTVPVPAGDPNQAYNTHYTAHQALPPRSSASRTAQLSRTYSGIPIPPPMLPSLSLTAADGQSAPSPYAPKTPQSMRPTLTRSVSANNTFRIPGPQSLSSVHEGQRAPSEIQRVATGPPGLAGLGGTGFNASNSGMFERTTSYGSESLSLQKRSMRWAAISETFASESAKVDKPGSAQPLSQQAMQQAAVASSGQVVHTEALQPGTFSNAVGSQEHSGQAVQGSDAAGTEASKLSRIGKESAVKSTDNSDAPGPQKRGSFVGALAKSIKKRVAFGGDAGDDDDRRGSDAKPKPGPVQRRSSAAGNKKQVKSVATGPAKPSSDMAVICGWAAKLEGEHSTAMNTATARARRIHMLWVGSHLVSAVACAVMSGLRGWRQLQVCMLVLLWAGVWSSGLEYAMSCIVHDTMDMHLEAGHTPGWDRRLRRAKRLFTLDRKAKGNTSKQLSEAEANELSVLKQEMNSLKKWYQHMRIASCVGLLRPQQLASVGAIETILQEPGAFTPLPAVLQQSQDDSQNQVDNSLGTIGDVPGSTPAAGSTAPLSPQGGSRRSGISAGGSTISINLPMDKALNGYQGHPSAAPGNAADDAHAPRAVGQHSDDGDAGRGSDAGSAADDLSDDGLATAVDRMDGLGSDSSSDSGSDAEANANRSKSKSFFQRFTGTVGVAAGVEDGQEGMYLEGHEGDEDIESFEQNEELAEDAMDSLLTAMEDAQSGKLDRSLSGVRGSGGITSSVRNAAESVFGCIVDDVRAARQTLVSVAGGIGGIAQGVGRAANTGRMSMAAGLSGSLIPVAEVQEQGQEQGPSRSPRYMPTDVVQSRRRSTMQARKSTGQGRIRTKSKPASVKEDLLLQPDSPV